MQDDSLTMDAARSAPPRAEPGRAARLLRAALREPLLHFLVLGGLVFAADAALHPPDRGARVIVVTKALRQSLIDGFDEDKERKPTEDQLRAMIDNWVSSEILYREGKALGVDRGDDTIRDRIAFKLQLLIFSQIDPKQPTEAELRDWFARNHARFDTPERVGFYIAPAATEEHARAQLAGIAAGAEPKDLARTTQAMLGRPVDSLAPSFGEGFREALMALPMGRWSVIRSKEGWHVVRYDAHLDAEPARLEDFHDEALHALQADDSRARAWLAIQKLKADYAVRYEDGA